MDEATLQLLVVVSPHWDAKEGTLYCYERTFTTLEWQRIGNPIAITLGQQGMAWGRGLYDCSNQGGIQKQEGDNRSPAGFFALGPVFGDPLHQSLCEHMPFLPVTENLECVDDPQSQYYNRFITEPYVLRDWTSSEKMKALGSIYALGIVIQHNLHPICPGKGSAIFMHIWKQQDQGTAGCTAMAEKDLQQIVSWLASTRYPCLVQLPLEEYKPKQVTWGLPELHDTTSH